MAADRSDEGRVQTGQAEQAQGALHGFAALFENPKQARQSDSWRRFFLSEAFLGEQLSEEFGERLLDYLRRQQACPEDNLPTGLLSELAIAYAIDQGRSGDIIVLAGKGHEDYQEIKGVKYPMDERNLIADILKERNGRS